MRPLAVAVAVLAIWLIAICTLGCDTAPHADRASPISVFDTRCADGRDGCWWPEPRLPREERP